MRSCHPQIRSRQWYGMWLTLSKSNRAKFREHCNSTSNSGAHSARAGTGNLKSDLHFEYPFCCVNVWEHCSEKTLFIVETQGSWTAHHPYVRLLMLLLFLKSLYNIQLVLRGVEVWSVNHILVLQLDDASQATGCGHVWQVLSSFHI